MRGRRCLVVGGGAIGARRVAALLECEADVTLISPGLCEAAQVLAERLKYLERPWQSGDCARFDLVWACTSSREVNGQIARESKEAGAWCGVADVAGEGDLHISAAVRRGTLCIGITTGGASPALSRHLKTRVQEAIGPEYQTLLGWMAGSRDDIKSRLSEQKTRAGVWRAVLESDVLSLLREGRADEAQKLFEVIVAREPGE